MKYSRLDIEKSPIWIHGKTGGLYHVMGVARCATNCEEIDENDVVVYFSVKHQTLNYRRASEFLDGRFDPVTPSLPKER